MMDAGPNPYVATFYSFKGGVGRTTLLVNVAHALAARGERVVIWDLDLEAPGVHHFPGLEPPEKPWQAGFLEWMSDTPLGDGAEPSPEWPSASSLRALTDRVYAADGRGRGKMFVLPAHGTAADIGRVHAAVDWAELFVRRPWHGVHLFKRVRDALIARFDASFLLVDSRTGVTDLGGLLTGFLPDCTVLVGNYSAQSTHGLRGVYVALDHFANDKHLDELRRDHKLERLIVASPVPSSEVARERGRARWRDGFPGVAPRSSIEVPLVENLLYAEDVLVRSAPSSDAARAYTRVAEQLMALRDARGQVASQLAAGSGARRLSESGADVSLHVRVARLLGLLGFETISVEGGVLVAHDRRPLGGAVLAIECRAGDARATPAWMAIYHRARERGESSRREPMVIAERVGAEARAAARNAGVTLRSLSELEDQLVDLRAYRDGLRRDFEASTLARGYVGQRFVEADGGSADAVTATLAWLSSAEPRLMLVVGDGGSGKSSFLRRLAYELVTRGGDDAELPAPLLIDLLAPAGVASLESVLQDHLRRALNWHGNPEVILYLLEFGRVVLLLDGFDELSSTSSEIGAEEQLRVLSRPTQQEGAGAAANRVIVSCRKYFARSEDGSTSGVWGMAERLGGTVRELAPFELDEIGQYLRNRLGPAKGGVALDNLQQTAGRDLKLTPFAVDLHAAIEEQQLAPGAPGAPAPSPPPGSSTTIVLLEHAARGWIQRGSAGSTLRPVQRERLIERLAAELWRLPDHELHHGVFAAQLQATERALLDGLDGDRLDRELRTASFLVRAASGTYRFSQRAFLEYFLACHLFSRAQLGAPALRAALATERLSPACVSVFAQRVARAEPVERRELLAAVRAVAAESPPDVTDNATRLLVALEAAP